MSTHNIRFHEEIRKISIFFFGKSALSGSMLFHDFFFIFIFFFFFFIFRKLKRMQKKTVYYLWKHLQKQQ